MKEVNIKFLCDICHEQIPTHFVKMNHGEPYFDIHQCNNEK